MMLLIAGTMAYGYLSGLEKQTDEIANRKDAGVAADAPMPDDADRDAVRRWGYHWVVVLVLVFLLIAVALIDVWAGYRYAWQQSAAHPGGTPRHPGAGSGADPVAEERPLPRRALSATRTRGEGFSRLQSSCRDLEVSGNRPLPSKSRHSEHPPRPIPATPRNKFPIRRRCPVDRMGGTGDNGPHVRDRSPAPTALPADLSRRPESAPHDAALP